jgi:hypothetical protein
LRINFTTYDCCWDQDMINTHTHSDVMVLLRTGLEGMMVSPEFSAAGSPTPRGAGLGFNF